MANFFAELCSTQSRKGCRSPECRGPKCCFCDLQLWWWYGKVNCHSLDLGVIIDHSIAELATNRICRPIFLGLFCNIGYEGIEQDARSYPPPKGTLLLTI